MNTQWMAYCRNPVHALQSRISRSLPLASPSFVSDLFRAFYAWSVFVIQCPRHSGPLRRVVFFHETGNWTAPKRVTVYESAHKISTNRDLRLLKALLAESLAKERSIHQELHGSRCWVELAWWGSWQMKCRRPALMMACSCKWSSGRVSRTRNFQVALRISSWVICKQLWASC